MKKIILSVLLIFVFNLITYAQIFTKPIVTFNSVSIESIGLSSIGMRLFLNVENPNILGIEIKKVDYNVSINNIDDFADGSTDKPLKIERKTKENPIEIPVNIKNKKIFSVVKSIISDPEKINYKATGKIYFGTFVGDISIPFSKESYIDNSESIKKIKDQIKSFSFF